MTNRYPIRHRRERGFTLMAVAASLLAIMGMAGLAIDLGRIYYVKSEMQAFCDIAALNAAMQLDGTSAGITAANAAVSSTAGTMKWDIGTKTIASNDIVVNFAQGQTAQPNTADSTTWSTNPANPAYYRFVQVAATVRVPLTFMMAVKTLLGHDNSTSAPVKADATAAQTMITTYPSGLLPFSPIAWAPTTADDFGLSPGTVYTIRYPPPSANNTVCAGDVGAPWLNQLPSRDRGYWGSTSAAALRGEVIDDQQLQSLVVGQPVPMVGGEKNTEGSALAARVAEDSDTTSPNFTAYNSAKRGNGRRVVGLPINSGPTVVSPYTDTFIAVGIGAFFLLTANNYNSVTASDPICAEYIGPYVEGKFNGGAGTAQTSGSTGGYIVRLVF